MQGFLVTLGICSITVSAIALLFMTLSPILAKRYSPKWQYYAWLIIILGLIIPFRLSFGFAFFNMDIPATGSIIQYHEQAASEPADTIAIDPASNMDDSLATDSAATSVGTATTNAENTETTPPMLTNNPNNFLPETPHAAVPLTAAWANIKSFIANLSIYQILGLIWLLGVLFTISYNLLKHHRSIKGINRWSEPVANKEILDILYDTTKSMAIFNTVQLKICPIIKSPMLIGLFKPTIILHTNDISADELALIIRHELTHYKRKDLWYKILVLIATAIHWFNPLVYLISKEIALQCEISCDNEAVRDMDGQAKQQYSETIIGVIRQQSQLKTVLSTNFYGGKKGMKKRIFSIMDTANKKMGLIIILCALILISGSGLGCTVNIVLANNPTSAGNITPAEENNADTLLTTGENTSPFGKWQLSVADIVNQNNTIATGTFHSLAIKDDGSLWAWGSNNRGQLGDGSPARRRPTPLKVMDDVVSVAAGWSQSFAIKNDGSLWAWGFNGYGQLGDGKSTDRYSPAKIMDNVIYISTRWNHSLAIKNDNTLWAWGSNEYGQLGDGTTTNKNIPVKILDNVIYASAGNNYSLAIKNDNSLWAWGLNSNGKLGDETETDRHSPVKIMDDVALVAAGDHHSLAIKNDGSLWAWGDPTFFVLLIDEVTAYQRYIPIKVMDNVVYAAIGTSHTLVLKSDGSLWTWGSNEHGQLGNNTNINKYTPAKISDNIVFLAAGNHHNLAIKNDGSLWTWGFNEYGQLGDGKTTDCPTPIRIIDDVKLPTFTISSSTPHSTVDAGEKPADNATTPPVINIYTGSATNVKNTSAQLNSSFKNNTSITEFGFYWGTTSNPTTKISILSASWEAGYPSQTLTGLQPNTTYYFRAYAGSSLGAVISFTTLPEY